MRWRDFDDLPDLPTEFFDSPRRVHFIGIGGIGMSALAQLLLSRGHQISGSDAQDSPLLDALRQSGARIVLEHSAQNVVWDGQNVDAVIWGSAITADNLEMAAAREKQIPTYHRAQLLAHFVNNADFSVAVSGTHGKSTTSAMIAHILSATGHNPTAILGAVYPPFKSNLRIGDPNLIIVEADESDGSFTLCQPTVAVVTNVEAEHLENYDNRESLLWEAFEQFGEGATEAVLNADDPFLVSRLDDGEWALRVAIQADSHLSADNISQRDALQWFELLVNGRALGDFALGVPGRFNVVNALCAIGASWLVEVDKKDDVLGSDFDESDLRRLARSLRDFKGVSRRFQHAGSADGVLVYDDYAHHPTEVQSTLEAACQALERPITAIFQPHRFSRTQQMGHLFGPAFECADCVIITELYSAFETPIEGVSGRIVFDAVKKAWPNKRVAFAENLDEARRIALEWTVSGAAIVTMGAGDIGTQPPLLLAELESRAQ